MSELDWQNAFNALFAISFGGIAWWIRNEFASIRERNSEEFDRIDRRINELKDTQVCSARDFRQDHTECQRALPNTFVTRREYEANQENVNATLARIEGTIREIFEILRTRQ